jgi:hypothetical protein
MNPMQNTRTKTPRSTSQTAIQLTLSNALDQSEKRLIEIEPEHSVREAVIDAGMAPSGQFDVFSSVGEVVTAKAAAQVEGETLYIGPARIAGGGILAKGDIVSIQGGAFDGIRARVTHVAGAKREVTVELFESPVPIPITIRQEKLIKEVN